MQNTNYLIKRKDRNYFSYQSKFNIPVSLQNHFGRKSFKISLKSGNYNACRGLSNRLHKLLKVLFQEIEMGKVMVETKRETIVLVLLKDTQLEKKL